jgi:hypothetical protein
MTGSVATAGHRRTLRAAWEVGRLLPTFVLFGLLKRLVSIRRLARMAWRAPLPACAPDAERLATARVLRAGAIAGWPDRDCLQRSLVLFRELSRLGANPELVVGFKPGDGGVEGHAWVTVRGRPVADELEGIAGFVPSLKFGPGGQLISGTRGPALPTSDGRPSSPPTLR